MVSRFGGKGLEEPEDSSQYSKGEILGLPHPGQNIFKPAYVRLVERDVQLPEFGSKC